MRYGSFFRPLAVIVFGIFLFSVCAFSQQATPASDRYYVMGAVSRPGDFELKTNSTVKTAIDSAGGLSSIADKKGAVLVRGSEKIPLELNDILTGAKSDVPLQGGDSVFVKPGTFRVEGKVKKPGEYDLKENLSAQQAIEMAGGLDQGGDLGSTYIQRDGKIINVEQVAAQGSTTQGTTLLPGDVVTVSEMTVAVTGEVKNPGMYALTPGQGDRLQDAIRAAGGPTQKANLKKVQLSVADGEATKTQVVDASNPNSPEGNPVLHKGNSVYVPGPELKKSVGLDHVYQAAAIILLIVSAF